MKQSKIIGIVVVISISLLGLLLAQTFWIRQSMQFAEQEFDRNVHRSLIGLNSELEQSEIAQFLSRYSDSTHGIQFMKQRLNDIKIHQSDVSSAGDSIQLELKTSRNHRQFKWKTDQEDSQGATGQYVYHEEIIVRDDSDLMDASKPRNYTRETVIVKSDGKGQKRETEDIRVEAVISDGDTMLNFEKPRVEVDTQVAQIFVTDSNAFKIAFSDKSRQIEEVALKLLLVEQEQDLSQRLDLDSLPIRIREQLSKQGIDLPFEFMVRNQKDEKIAKISSNADSSALKNSPYNTALLTTGLQPAKAKLYLEFPSKFQYLMGKIWVVVLLSLLFIVLISVTFYYTIRSMIRQRKIADLKNDFVSNMTHELKTPITSINLACETLNDEAFPFEKDSVKNYLSIISQENARLELLVNNVLESSFFDSDRMKLDKSTFDLKELVQREVDRFRLIVEKANGTLTFNAEGSFPIHADAFHVSNVVHNLIDNAIKYSPDKVEITLNMKKEADSVLLTVADKGKGIPKREQEKIFDKFHRIQKGDVHDVKGYGLGLYYVKRILDLHGAEIDLKSSEGEGCVFGLRFKV